MIPIIRPIKTADEHLEFLQEMIKLKLWFIAFWNEKKEDYEDVFSIVNERTTLVSYTTLNEKYLYDNPGCNNLILLSDLIRRIKYLLYISTSFEEFVSQAYPFFEDKIEGRVEFDMKVLDCALKNKEYRKRSCFGYNLNQEGDSLAFHVDNNRYPDSVLDDPQWFKRWMIKMVQEADQAGFKSINCGSWLNDNDRWNELFPPSWTDNTQEAMYGISGDLGFWGQFISSRQTFRHKLGKQFRETGKMPYQYLTASATIEEFKEFLEMK